MGFVSIDNRPEFFIDLLNSSYLNDTFMYNVTNVSSNSIDANEEEEANTIEFVLMSLVTVLLGLLILITIIGESHRRHSAQYVLLILSSFFFLLFFRKRFCHHSRVNREASAKFRQLLSRFVGRCRFISSVFR